MIKAVIKSSSIKKIILVIFSLIIMTGCSTVKKRNDYKVSKHFTFYEATNSRTAKSRGLKNYPNRKDFKTIKYTAGRMEKIRKIVGVPLTVNSWYRSPNTNRLIGGSSTSAHRYGLAVDFTIRGNARIAFDRIRKSGYSFDQMIYYKRRNYVHISFRKNKKTERRQIFIKR